jgi:membrane associated rhomboid family serine protease
MTIDRILIAYMVVVGIAVGAIVTLLPQAREFRLPPYFWVLIAIALFDLAAFARGRGAPGTTVGMDARLLGFVVGVVLMVVIPVLFGVPLPKLF